MPKWWGTGQSQPGPQSDGALDALFRRDLTPTNADPPEHPGHSWHNADSQGDGVPEEQPAQARERGDAETAMLTSYEGDPWYRRARVSFRRWRRTRPFWAGLLCLFGGALMAYGPLSVFRYVLVAGTVIWAGVLMGLLVCAMGLFLWFTPQFRQLVGVLAAIFSVVSLITSNFGGFVIGMLLGSLGGAMGFAWTPLPEAGRAAGTTPATPAPPGEANAGEHHDGHDVRHTDPGAPARARAAPPVPPGAVSGHRAPPPGLRHRQHRASPGS